MKGFIRFTVAALAASASFVMTGPAHAGGSCPVGPYISPSGDGVSYSIDPGDAAAVPGPKTCGVISVSGGGGHVWLAFPGLIYVGPLGGPYVAVGNDNAGNPDNSSGCPDGATDCTRGKAGPYACVSTSGGPAYGPRNGTVVCPVD